MYSSHWTPKSLNPNIRGLEVAADYPGVEETRKQTNNLESPHCLRVAESAIQIVSIDKNEKSGRKS